MWVIRLAVTGMAKNGRQVGHLFFIIRKLSTFASSKTN